MTFLGYGALPPPTGTITSQAKATLCGTYWFRLAVGGVRVVFDAIAPGAGFRPLVPDVEFVGLSPTVRFTGQGVP